MLTLSPRRIPSTSLLASPSRRQKTPSPQKPLLIGVFSPSKVSPLQSKLKAADGAHRGKPSAHVHHVQSGTAENSGPEQACPSLSIFSDAPISLCSVNSVSNHLFQKVDIWPSTVPLPLATSYPRDIELPFSLMDSRHRMRGPNAEEATMIMEIFPTAHTIQVSPPFLTVVCTSIPKIPLPTSIAGIPCVFTDNENVMSDLQGIDCRGPHMLSDREYPLFELPPFADRVEILRELMSAGATEIGWLGTRWVIMVENPDEETQTKLPRTIANLVVSYIPEEKHHKHSLRRKSPEKYLLDNSDYYPYLHGGMMISDGTIFSASGIPVRHPDDPDASYFTVSKHAFVHSSTVVHPSPAVGHVLGKIANIVVGGTDIALCRVEDDSLRYATESFAGPRGTIKFTGLARSQESYLGQRLYFDSPFTGLAEGYCTGQGCRRIPSDVPGEAWRFVEVIWTDIQRDGIIDPMNGCCGSPIWDAEGKVHAFFHYFNDSSTRSFCPTPDALIDLGYELSAF